MKWHRTQYLDYMLFRGAERPMFAELFGPLVGLEEEWRRQGASDDELAMVGFDWDYVPACYLPVNVSFFGGPAPVVLEDNAEFRIVRDALGRRTKLIKAVATISLPLEFPVKNMDDWRRIKPQLEFREGRIDWAAMPAAKAARDEGSLTLICILGAFNAARELMGEEVACLAYYEQPELMHDILDTITRMQCEVFRRIEGHVGVDQLSISEDLAGRTGSFVGPKQIDAFVGPYYRTAAEALRPHGVQIISMDTDGNVNSVLDDFLRYGLNTIEPMEPAAGMDPVATRKRLGRRLSMLGGIDKHVLRRSKAEIRKEMEYKMQPSMRDGGMVFSLDHRIPNGTPLENYRYYVQLGREILGLPALDGKSKGWARMAL